MENNVNTEIFHLGSLLVCAITPVQIEARSVDAFFFQKKRSGKNLYLGSSRFCAMA